MQNRKKKKTDLYNSLLDSVGEGEGVMFQENSIETCILSFHNFKKYHFKRKLFSFKR